MVPTLLAVRSGARLVALALGLTGVCVDEARAVSRAVAAAADGRARRRQVPGRAPAQARALVARAVTGTRLGANVHLCIPPTARQ